MTLRAFIAVDFDATKPLRQLLQGIRSTRSRVRAVAPENLHITLKFLGDMDEGRLSPVVDVLQRAAEGISPFTLTLRGTGAFPRGRSPRVLWVGVRNGEPLVTLAQRVESGLLELGFPREKRRFSPHLTVARVKSRDHLEDLLAVFQRYQDRDFGEQHVDAVRLKKSELRPTGAVYSDVTRIPLT